MPRRYWSAPATTRSHWSALVTPRSHWSAPATLRPYWTRLNMPRLHRSPLFSALLYFILLVGVSPVTSQWSSPPPPAPAPSPAPHPPHQLEPSSPHIQSTLEQPHNAQTDETNVQRDKRSSQWDNTDKTAPVSRRVKTGDTILNIRGAVRDAIGDAGAAGGGRASSRLDTFVIRGAQARASPRLLPLQQLPSNQVPRESRELLVEPHARATIPCDLNNVTDLVWYKDNEVVPLGGRSATAALWLEASAAVVGRATRGDAGAWRCAGRTRGKLVSGEPTHLLIYESVRAVYLAVDGRRLDAGNTWVPVRDKTELEVRCVAEGGVPPPELSWRLLAVEPSLDHRPYLRVQPTNYTVAGVSWCHAAVTAARELHNATLQCAATQRRPARDQRGTAPRDTQPRDTQPRDTQPRDTQPRDTPDTSNTAEEKHALTAKLEIHVTYPPSFVISRWPGFGVSLSAGGAAALRCDVDANPPARAWWLRDDDNPTSSPPPLDGAGVESRGSATLRWEALQGSHAGWYRCRASWLDHEYSSIGYYLNVIAPEEHTEAATEATTAEEEHEPEHQKVDVPVGGNVQLHCPKGSVGCWWRKVVGNASGGGWGAGWGAGGGAGGGAGWAGAGSSRAHGVLGIKDALYEEGGEYRCLGARPPDTQKLRELKRVTVRVTGAATAAALSAQPSGGGWRLECGACGRGVRVVWVRGGGGGGGGDAAGGTLAAETRRAGDAHLTPDLAQHCWRAVLHVNEPDEVWCVAAAPGGGAVAVFPPRAPHPSPAPARHTVHTHYNTSTRTHTCTHTYMLVLLTWLLTVYT